jgi:plastocyanin
MTQHDRRKFLSMGAVGLAATAFGVRAVLAQDDDDATPDATDATPAATPEATPAAEGESIEVIAVDIDFEPDELTIPADTDVEITLVNEGVLEHDFVVEDTDFRTEIIRGGEEDTITVNLSAGEYVYYCSVPGHREAGMEGTLIVE